MTVFTAALAAAANVDLLPVIPAANLLVQQVSLGRRPLFLDGVKNAGIANEISACNDEVSGTPLSLRLCNPRSLKFLYPEDNYLLFRAFNFHGRTSELGLEDCLQG
ncbi:hypothetical protein CDL15_Pgr023753 [Punica granatum]|nr:hypothetical protein CDL15_Pgr023753 [Punica granatum]